VRALCVEVVGAPQERSIARKTDRQLTHRNAARSVTAMAAMLAHEVKNPLSGIRGAAQLLEQNAAPSDRELTRLICDESDRVCALVDRMEVFSDQRPIERGRVNIHEVLERVRKVAQSGFARHVRLAEEYDPVAHRQEGNFPQAFSHIGLSKTAVNLSLRQEGPAKQRPEEEGRHFADFTEKDDACLRIRL